MFRIISVAIYRALGYPPDQSWVDNSCDTWDSVYGWDRAPCTACTLPNSVRKNIHFEMRGLCDRWHQCAHHSLFTQRDEYHSIVVSRKFAEHNVFKISLTPFK